MADQLCVESEKSLSRDNSRYVYSAGCRDVIVKVALVGLL